MDDDSIWQRDEVESPCVKLCLVHPDARVCLGCHRTIDEIARWSAMTAAERREIMEQLPGRGQSLRVRRGGRAARLARLEGE